MSHKLAKVKTQEQILKEQKKEKNKKIKNKILLLIKILFGILLFISLSLFCIYKYYHYTTGFTIYFQKYNIQNEYARFLIEINDSFIENMVAYDNIAIELKNYDEYTEFEKDKMKNIIQAEGSIMSRLEKTPPNDSNLDYKELYNNMLESYALYVQGQAMEQEYIYQTQDGMSPEHFTLGHSVTKLVGNFVIDYNEIINGIRNTDYDFVYSSNNELFDIKTGDFEQEQVQRDENGNVIVDKDKNYLYLPEQNVTYGTSEEQEELNEDVDVINQYINDYFKIKDTIQN